MMWGHRLQETGLEPQMGEKPEEKWQNCCSVLGSQSHTGCSWQFIPSGISFSHGTLGLSVLVAEDWSSC